MIGAIWTWFAGSKIGRWVVIASLAIGAYLYVQGRAEKRGVDKERRRAVEADQENADAISDRVDRARAGRMSDTPDPRIFRD